jgi:hypothetical protein
VLLYSLPRLVLGQSDRPLLVTGPQSSLLVSADLRRAILLRHYYLFHIRIFSIYSIQQWVRKKKTLKKKKRKEKDNKKGKKIVPYLTF